jgi:hypothetical protein
MVEQNHLTYFHAQKLRIIPEWFCNSLSDP